MGQQGKINWPEHTASGLQNKGTEKLQRRAAPSPLEVGGRGEGKGANSAPEKPPPPTLQTGLRFLSKDFQRFWMVDIRRDGRGSRLEANSSKQTQAARAGAAEGKGAPHPERVGQASGCLNRSGRGRHETQAQLNPRFCGGPENWNCTQRRALSIQSSWEPEQCRQGKHIHP